MRKGQQAPSDQLALFAEAEERPLPPEVTASAGVAPLSDGSPRGDKEPAVTPRERMRGARPPVPIGVTAVTPAPSAPLDQAIPAYLTYLTALNRSQHTLKSFELDLRLLRGQVGNRAVGAIDTSHLRQFIAWVRVTRENTPNSLRRKVATLKNFFGYLRDEGYIDASPADLLPYPAVQLPLPEFLEEDAALRLVEVTEDNPFWRALVVLMLDTGLKRDEVLALRVADVRLEPDDGSPVGAGYLVVRATDAAKRLRSRQIPLTERLRDVLRHYYNAIPRPHGESRVFDISIRGINFIVETCGQRAGIVTSKPRLTPQALRETFAVTQMRRRVQEERRCQMRGWNGEALQLLTLRHDHELLELLGLKDDPDTAQKYRRLVNV